MVRCPSVRSRPPHPEPSPAGGRGSRSVFVLPSEIGAAAADFPVAVAGRFRAFGAADLLLLGGGLVGRPGRPSAAGNGGLRPAASGGGNRGGGFAVLLMIPIWPGDAAGSTRGRRPAFGCSPALPSGADMRISGTISAGAGVCAERPIAKATNMMATAEPYGRIFPPPTVRWIPPRQARRSQTRRGGPRRRARGRSPSI